MKDKNKIRQAFDMIRIPDGEPSLGAVIGGEPLRQDTGRQIKVRRSGGIIAAAAAAVILAGGVFAAYKIGRIGTADDVGAVTVNDAVVVADNGDIRLTASNIRCDGHILLVHYDYEKLYADKTDRRLEESINNRLHSIFRINGSMDDFLMECNINFSNLDETANGDRICIFKDDTESVEANISIYENEGGTETEILEKVFDMTDSLRHTLPIKKTCNAISFKSETGGLVTLSELGFYCNAEVFYLIHPTTDREAANIILIDKEGKEYDMSDRRKYLFFHYGAGDDSYRSACVSALPVNYQLVEKIKIGDKIYSKEQ
ncbi:MAG: hypothetical protein IKO27_08615 [Ruminococcus sp.]|nr:hypothetical protein [Ruminococcus sp.]